MKRQLFLLGAAICVITAAFSISARSQTNRALQDKQMQEDVTLRNSKRLRHIKLGYRPLSQQLLGRVLSATHSLRGLAPSGNHRQHRNRRCFQSDQAGSRHRGSDQQSA